MCRLALLAVIATMLSGCSYDYDLLAVVRDGELTFIVSQDSLRDPNCFRQIEVVSAERIAVDPAPGDDSARAGYGTVWRDEVEYEDDCDNKFPAVYGRGLNGIHRPDHGLVQPKPLARNIVYEINTVSGATGYGSGRFLIHDDGRVENLPKS